MQAKIVLLPGDGIGPEIIDVAQKVLHAVATKFEHSFSFESHLIGGCAIDETGTALPEATLNAAKKADAILLGAVGGPKWDDPKATVRPEQGLLAIRKSLDLFANIRPVKLVKGLESASPLKAERLDGVDLLFVRELTGGIYFGQPRGRDIGPNGRRGWDTLTYDEQEIRRIMKVAFEIARKRRKLVTSIDKANVLDTMRVWREVATEVGQEYPDVQLEHQLVDSAAMKLVTHPSSFDVIVADNMFGDILSDEGAVLTGSLGLLPSASLGEGKNGLYEPIHGSAPDIAGKGIANPLATILSAAMLLRHSLDLEKEAQLIETAVNLAIADGLRTSDLGGGAASLSTQQMGNEIITRINA